MKPAGRGTAINLIGGSAYCSTGGIQGMNRRLVTELGKAELLRRAHFLWDDAATATDEARTHLATGLLEFHARKRPALALALLRDALRHRGDRWLCTHVNYGALALLASGFRSRNVAIMVHAAELQHSLSRSKRWALRHAGCVIAVSEYSKKKAERLGVDSRRIRVLRNGVDDPCPGRPKRTDTGDKTTTVLFVGRMDEHYKGQRELIDAMVLLRKRLPELRLVFVGGGSLGKWQDEARQAKVADIVTFAGHASDAELSRLYATAGLFAMPSEDEGFGLVYAEAMAQGLPCIGSDRDAAREVIAHGETGLCVPAGNSTALADAILTIMRSPKLRERMGQAGRARFESCFSAEAYRHRLLGLMREWMEEGKARVDSGAELRVER